MELIYTFPSKHLLRAMVKLGEFVLFYEMSRNRIETYENWINFENVSRN
jgi:hypothetical protein